MRKGNLIKMAAPAILSAAMMVSGLPVMAADFTSDTAVETEAQTDEFDAADDTADAFAGDEETPFVDDQAAAEDEFAATAETGYKYVYAGLTWTQYWASEGVYNAANTASNGTKDSHDELDKGGFDTVTRATVNHGLHRGSYQCEAIMYDKNGGSYEISYWTSANDAVLTDGTTVKLNQPERGQITKADGSVAEFDHYSVVGLKYVPVAVKAEDYEAFKSQFKIVEDGSTIAGGFGENNLQSYSAVADVTAETNGLKEAVKGSDGTFTFKARTNGTGSGLKDQALQTASNVTATVKEASGSYGEFLRVDITGDGYGTLGAKMYAVKWDYYGNGDKVLASYGTKFAADNWMHKAMGIQLGLTDSLRCKLPEGTDGTGYWTITLTALGYNDVTYKFQATEENIVKASEDKTITTTNLEAAIAKAEALKEAEYTAESWASMQMELQEAKDELKNPKTQATVDEAVSHLNAAIEALVKIEEPAAVDTSSLEKVISDAAALKEADYTVDSWKALQSALTDAKSALNAKESQEKVDKATDALNAAIKALVKNGNQAGSQNGSATPTVTKKAGTTTDGSASKGTSGSKAAKTGDPANVLGLLGLAFSSLGAGVGGFAWKRKRK